MLPSSREEIFINENTSWGCVPEENNAVLRGVNGFILFGGSSSSLPGVMCLQSVILSVVRS